MSDTLGAVKVQADLCNLSQESKRTEVFLSIGIVYAVAALLVGMRISGKILTNHVSMDDWIVVTALLLLALPVGCVMSMTKIGFGRHLWDLQDGQLLRILRYCKPSLSRFLCQNILMKTVWIAQSFYVLVLALIKISLIYFYLEIFTSRQFRISAYVILVYITINSLIIFFLTIFSCYPVSAFWDRDKKGTCLNVQALAYANSGSAIVQDVILLILPLVFLRHLQMERNRKIVVGFMFMIGTFGCIATMIRLKALLGFKISLDPTWDYVPSVIWTELELAAGFACVSLPTIRKLFIRMLPPSFKKFLSTITRSSRSPSSQDPVPSQSRSWRKPASWKYVGSDGKKHDSTGRGDGMSLHSYDSRAPSAQNYVKPGTEAVFTKFPCSTKSLNIDYDHSNPLELGDSNEPILGRSLPSHGRRDSRPTAFSPVADIGCLPDGSWSDPDVAEESGRVRYAS